MSLLKLISKLLQVLEEDFYKRLLNGKIEKAKAGINYTSYLILNIQNELTKIIDNVDIKEDLPNLKRELQEKFAEWRYIIEKELEGVSDKDFEEDPAIWIRLFEESIKKPTNNLLLIVKRLYGIIDKKNISPAQQVQVISTGSYDNIKYRKKVYNDNLNTINKIEKKICEKISSRDHSNGQITGKIKSGRWRGFLHAHLPMPLGNHRIVYLFNGKEIILLAIGTHKELEID